MPRLSAALHACKLCRFYDVEAAKQCREPIAEEVRDKDRENYCDYFTPRAAAYSNRSEQHAGAAQAQLEALFVGPKHRGSEPQSGADRAKAELEKLFGKKS